MSHHPPPEHHTPPRQQPSSPTHPAHSTHAGHPWQRSQPSPSPDPTRRAPDRPPLGHHSDLRILRGAYRRQRRVATLTALGYFTVFLVLSAFAPSFMTGTITPGLPTGLVLALLQLPVTGLAIALYERTARRRVDPLAERVRKQAALDARREATTR
ncbi:DUF485 domain-containing protein [Streptomyces griseus]|uniref:DUF485 domain-containing protein n=1 Tax=Streptomyces griseus TaxID=1911 RepID=UPI0005618035|nr:DUF485 domain-containing protein [Streptomyces griseus]